MWRNNYLFSYFPFNFYVTASWTSKAFHLQVDKEK